MNKIKSTPYLLVTDVIYNDGENAKRYNALLWWNVKHRNTTLKLHTVIKDGKPITIMSLYTPQDRPELVSDFEELVSKVNGLYPVYDLITVCARFVNQYEEEDKATKAQD